jgi:hypothetical protein
MRSLRDDGVAAAALQEDDDRVASGFPLSDGLSRMRHPGPWLISILLLSACSIDPTVGAPEKVNGRKAPEVVLDHRGLGVPVDTLVSTALSASDSFGVLTSVAVVGDYVVAGEAYDAPYFHVLDRSDGSLLASFGRTGSGPGEFNLAPQFIPTAPGTTTLWVAPQLGRQLVELDVRAIVQNQPDWLVQTVNMEDPGFRPAGLWLTPEELVVRSYTPTGDAPLVIFDAKGTRQDSLATVSIPDGRLRAGSRWGAYMFAMCASPNGEHIAAAFANTGRLEIRSRASRATIDAQVPYRFRPHLPLLGKIMMDFKGGTAGNRRAYSDCVATNSLIYATFAGTLRGKQRNAPPPANTFVHVFDWSGRLVRVHHLDHVAYGIDLDRENGVLYSVSSYPDSIGPSVRRTVLPR